MREQRGLASKIMTGAESPRRPSLTIVGVLTSVFVALLVAASCGSSKGSSVSASEAGSTVAAVFDLSPDQQRCLEEHFASDPDARRVLVGQEVASEHDLTAMGQVEAACISPETLAAAITSGASDAFGGTLTDTQTSCLSDGVLALGDDERQKLLVGLVVSNSGALGDADLAEMGKVTSGLLEGCHLDTATSQTAPASPGTTG
jgi:hypothetical protein